MSAAGPLPRRSPPPPGRWCAKPRGGEPGGGYPERRRAAAGRQRGTALFVVMILLLAMVWFALSSFRISSQQLQIVGNAQADQHATAAAQRAIDLTISSNAFTADPTTVASTPIATDVDGDGKDDLTAVLTPKPKCVRVRPIKTTELDIAKVADRACLVSSGSGGSLVESPGQPVASGNSLCANSEWDVAAAVDDAVSNTAVTVHQGVAVRVVATDAATFCK